MGETGHTSDLDYLKMSHQDTKQTLRIHDKKLDDMTKELSEIREEQARQGQKIESIDQKLNQINDKLEAPNKVLISVTSTVIGASLMLVATYIFNAMLAR